MEVELDCCDLGVPKYLPREEDLCCDSDRFVGLGVGVFIVDWVDIAGDLPPGPTIGLAGANLDESRPLVDDRRLGGSDDIGTPTVLPFVLPLTDPPLELFLADDLRAGSAARVCGVWPGGTFATRKGKSLEADAVMEPFRRCFRGDGGGSEPADEPVEEKEDGDLPLRAGGGRWRGADKHIVKGSVNEAHPESPHSAVVRVEGIIGRNG